MKRTIAALAASLFFIPSVSMAAGLTYQQASSVIILLQAFGVNQTTINEVWGFIAPSDSPLSPPTIATIQNQEPAYQAPIVTTPPPIVNRPPVVQSVPMPPLVTKLTAAINPELGNQTIAPGTKKAKIASFTLTTDTDAIRLFGLTLSITGSDQSPQLYSYLQNLEVVQRVSSDENGLPITGKMVSPSWGEIAYTFSVRLTESTTNTFDVYADVNEGIPNTLSITLSSVWGGSDSTGVNVQTTGIPLQVIAIQ